MNELPESLENLVEQFRKLPTIGKKTAQRLALHMVTMDAAGVDRFAESLLEVKRKIHPCEICGNITEDRICSICADPRRDRSTVCVVEDVSNLIAMERSGNYRGVYHVLDGLISPMRDIGPEQMGVDRLLARFEGGEELASTSDRPGQDPPQLQHAGGPIREVILAISATVEGETTMLFLAELLKKYSVRVSRIASGIPVGGSLEYYDELTLSKALEDRRSVSDEDF